MLFIGLLCWDKLVVGACGFGVWRMMLGVCYWCL